ncbi:MAG: hypothetical protein ACOYBP_06415 [Microbacteriaceae bacterium]
MIGLSLGWAVFVNMIDPANSTTTHYGLRIVVVLLLQALLFVMLWLLNVIWIRRIRLEWRWLALLLSIIGFAMLRGAALGVALYFFGVTSVPVILPRIIAGLVNHAIFIVVIAVATGMLTESAQARRQQVMARARLVDLREQATRRQVEHNREVIEGVRSQLAASLLMEVTEPAEAVLSKLRQSIDEVVRPLSRSLDSAVPVLSGIPEPEKARIHWSMVLRQMLDASQLRIPPMVLLYAVALIPSVMSIYSLWSGLALMLVLPGLLALGTGALRYVAHRLGRRVESVALIPVLALSTIAINLVLSRILPSSFLLSYLIGDFGMVAFCGLVPVFVRVSIQQSEQITNQLRSENAELEWQLARVRAESFLQNRAISIALHGSVQAALSATALRLQLALRDDENPVDAVVQARADAHRAVAFDVDFSSGATPIAALMSEAAELWEGVCAIENDLSAADCAKIDSDPVCARLAGDVLVELCMNAVKHGKATRVSISATVMTGRLCEVSVADNGQYCDPNGATAAGGGTQLLDQVSVRWERTTGSEGTRVTAWLPWDDESPASFAPLSPDAPGGGGTRNRPLTPQ